MNTAIENLNQWGGQFLDLAAAMFWQSSLLGLVLLILDFGLRRHLRASVRYALWLVFLVKLVIPPSLALPTSPAWWWSSATHLPLPAPQFQFSTYTVTAADTLAPESLLPLPPESIPPPSALTGAAVGLLVAGGVSACLFFWLLLRWRQVVRAGRAAIDDPAFFSLREEARRLGKIRSPVRLKITGDTMSPAVCGLFRPVILLPQTLVDKLSAEQLRAVLLHELMHLRRGDVWVNFGQSLLQIIYWWHPLVWLANARIRRVREEAVDDAVMVALREDAEIYAPTLLAVAKFAFRRPLASLGLVGILESRSALRQRIERLVNLPVPRKAGLTLLSACGILGFASVALPMGDAPEPDGAPAGQAIATNISTNVPLAPIQSAYVPPVANPYAQTGVVNTGPGRHDIVAKLDHIHLARVDFDGVPLSEVIRNLSAQARLLDPQKTGINFLINPNPDLSGSLPPADGIIQIDPATGQPAAPAASATEPLDPDSVKVKLSLADVRLVDVLDAIVLVADQPIKYSIQDFGVVFSPKPAGVEALFTRTFKVDANTFNQGLESVGSASVGAGGVSSVSGGGGIGNNGRAVVPRAYFVPGAGQGAQPPGGGTVGAGGVGGQNGEADVFTPKHKSDGMQVGGINIRIRNFFHDHGVNLNPPKSVYYNDGRGMLSVKASKADLEKIGHLLDTMELQSSPPPFKPKFTGGQTTNSGASNFKTNAAPDATSNGAGPTDATVTGIITNPKFQAAIHALEQRQGAENQDEPKVVTTSGGRQNQISSASENLFRASSLVQDGKLLYEMGKLDEAKSKLNEAIALNPENAGAQYYLNLTKQAEETGGVPTKSAAQPEISSPATPTAAFKLTANPGLRNLRQQAGLTDLSAPDEYLSAFAKLLANTGNSLPTNSLWFGDQSILLVRGTPAELSAVEKMVCGLNGLHVKDLRQPAADAKSVSTGETSGGAAEAATKLYMRTFKVSSSTFLAGLQKAVGQSPSDGRSEVLDQLPGLSNLFEQEASSARPEMPDLLHTLFNRLGVNMGPPKTIFYNDGLGLLFVRATEQDLDTIERAIDVLNAGAPPSQMHIKIRFIEIGDLQLDIAGIALNTDLQDQTTTCIMGSQQAAKFIRQLKAMPGFETLAEPEVTMTSGRQTDIKSTQVQTVIDGINPQALRPPGVSSLQATNLFHFTTREFGPFCDVVPIVLADGYTVNLTAIPSLVEFAGYDQPTNQVLVYFSDGRRRTDKVPVPNPRIIIHELEKSAVLYDNQTLVLIDNQPRLVPLTPVNSGNPFDPSPADVKRAAKRLVILVTVTMVDAAGNRVHTDEEMPFARDHAPPQALIQNPARRSHNQRLSLSASGSVTEDSPVANTGSVLVVPPSNMKLVDPPASKPVLVDPVLY